MANKNYAKYNHNDGKDDFCEVCAIYHSQIVNYFKEDLFAGPKVVYYPKNPKSGLEDQVE